MKIRLLSTARRLWNHLNPRRRGQFLWLAGLMIFCAMLEAFSLGAVLPFVGVLTAPEKLLDFPLIVKLMDTLGLVSPKDLKGPLTLVFVSAAVFSGVMRLILLRMSTRLAFSAGAELSSEVYRRTLYQPYRIHLARNSSEIVSGITMKVTLSVNVLYQVIALLSSTILLLSITVALVVIDPIVASLAAISFGSCYFFISFFFRRRLLKNSQLIASKQTQAIKILQEGLGGIRDVLLDSSQAVFSDIYRNVDQPLRSAKGDIIFLSGSPRFVMESIGMTIIALLALYISHEPGGIASGFPVLAALAIGAQRMLPALQQCYSSWTSIVGDQASLEDTLVLLDQKISDDLLLPQPAPLKFEKEIRFNNISFRYNAHESPVLNDFNLEIPKGSRVGFVGVTGSGKTTALDILMGLLEPDSGQILVDGSPISEKTRAWQRTIANVPQGIFLSDSSIAENIAFGVPLEKIDVYRVKQAAEKAQISDFIASNKSGYNALVGERGVRLSGGQRQRLGIARALYKQASVLVFDEATSALDNATESSVMEAIEGLDRSLTILIIAHRLTTIKNCDFIVEVDQGRVVAQGSFDQLVSLSPSFKKMAVGMNKDA